MILVMGNIKAGGYQFVTWIGDHAPKHVHVYGKGGRLALKWNLEAWEPISGRPTRRILKELERLRREGRL